MARRSPQESTKRSVAAPLEESSTEEREAESSGGHKRWWWTSFRVLAGLLLVVVSAGLVAYGARQFAVTSDRFAVREFAVEGSARFTPEQLARLAGVNAGDNLFALDLEQAEQRLTENPWIATAALSRKLPATLEIVVEEYRAEALAVIDDVLYLITRDGYPIIELGEGEHGDYPVISGVAPDELLVDRVRAMERLARGLEILRRYERMPLASSYPAQEIHMATDGAVQLVVGERGITLQLGKGPVGEKLLMAARVLGKVRARGETPAIVFLDNVAHPERVVVRLR